MAPERLSTPEGNQVDGIRQSLNQYVSSAEFPEHVRTQNSRDAYCRDFRLFRQYCNDIGVSSLEELHPSHISNWQRVQEENKCSPASVQRRLSSVRSFARWACGEGLLSPNFVERLEHLPKIESPNRSTPFQPLTPEQQQALINLAEKKSRRDSALIQLILKTGARIEEVISLNTKDVAFFEDGEAVIKFNDNERREVQVDSQAEEALRRYISEKRLEPNQPLFPPSRRFLNERTTRQGINLMLKKYGGKIGIKLNPTILRFTFVANFDNGYKKLATTLGMSEGSALRLYRLRQPAKSTS